MDRHDILTALKAQMQSRYGIRPEEVRFVWAPYRVCPLGAHIDHQLGTVTAMAIDQGVHLAYAPSSSPEVRLGSLSYPGEVRFSLDRIASRQEGDWGNYVRGAAWALAQRYVLSQGIIGITSGSLAEGGLSSSASVGVAYLLALEQVNDLRLSARENIQLDQAIENAYLGLNNGILDQAAILLSQRDHLTVIDCRAFALGAPSESSPAATRSIRLIAKPASLSSFAIFIACSGVTKANVSTDYNRRVSECTEAARILLKAVGRPHDPAVLGELSLDEFEEHRSRLSGAPAKRVEHFFSETKRVQSGIQAWERGDLAGLGRLMTESGRSSIVHYECGSPPLIDLYEILVRTPGVYGARFCGAGFRGCCVALADPAAVQQILPEIEQAYAKRHPCLAADAQFLTCGTDDGARLL